MSKSKKIISACVAGAAAVGLGAFAVIVHKDDKEVPTFSTIEVQPTTAPEVDPRKTGRNCTAILRHQWDFRQGHSRSCVSTRT